MESIIKYKKIAVILGLLSCIAACDATIHEYPAPEESLVIIEPHINREPPLYYKEVVYDDKWNRIVRDLERRPAMPYDPDEKFEMRLLLEIYHGTTEEESRSVGREALLVEQRLLHLDREALPPQDTVHFSLPVGEYHLLAWADYIYKNDQYGSIYNADTLSNIRSNLKNYPENTHHRSSSAGQEAFAVDFTLGPEGYPVRLADPLSPIRSRKIPVMMERPSGRYRIIASDFDEFVKDGGRLEGATVKVVYKQYVSVGYNVATREPNLFVSTYSFNTHPAQDVFGEEGSISLFCDYLFCSFDKEDTIVASFYFYDSSGKEFNHCENIEIPLKRDHETVVKGHFLTNKVGKDSNVSIDEEFEGEYTVEIN